MVTWRRHGDKLTRRQGAGQRLGLGFVVICDLLLGFVARICSVSCQVSGIRGQVSGVRGQVSGAAMSDEMVVLQRSKTSPPGLKMFKFL